MRGRANTPRQSTTRRIVGDQADSGFTHIALCDVGGIKHHHIDRDILRLESLSLGAAKGTTDGSAGAGRSAWRSLAAAGGKLAVGAPSRLPPGPGSRPAAAGDPFPRRR